MRQLIPKEVTKEADRARPLLKGGAIEKRPSAIGL